MSGRLGATPLRRDRCRFLVWAPRARRVEIHVAEPAERIVALAPRARGYFTAVAEEVPEGSLYRIRLDGREGLPDPASRSQPQGVHGPSQVAARDFPWSDAGWSGATMERLVTYELHVGAFTSGGTFADLEPHLEELAALGVTAVELMPVQPFAGRRNWGYDGVYPFAVHADYGGARGLKSLVDACHRVGLAVALDVVCNHLGPEGNYLHAFGPYFAASHRTPWGEALNFDGAGSDEVRRYFVEAALQWVEEFHVDVLRLDAVHAIRDHSPRPFVAELAAAVHRRAERLGRRALVIAEDATNDPRLVRPPEAGGLGLDGVWSDDFHHALHALLTGERSGYYADFGAVAQLARAFREAFVFTGQYSSYRGRRRGAPPGGIPASCFVVYAQNHDQVGNRPGGERLCHLVPPGAARVAAALVALSPFAPLLFMGEEHAEATPFLFFTSHGDASLADAVRAGRRTELTAFGLAGEPPDPQSEATFAASHVDHSLRERTPHREMRALHGELLRLRREVPALADPSLDRLDATASEQPRALLVRRWCRGDEAILVAHFDAAPAAIPWPIPRGTWQVILDTEDAAWGGRGASAPAQVVSDGEARVTLAPTSALLLVRR